MPVQQSTLPLALKSVFKNMHGLVLLTSATVITACILDAIEVPVKLIPQLPVAYHNYRLPVMAYPFSSPFSNHVTTAVQVNNVILNAFT